MSWGCWGGFAVGDGWGDGGRIQPAFADAGEVGAAARRAVVGKLRAWGRARGTQADRDPRLEVTQGPASASAAAVLLFALFPSDIIF